MAKTWPHLLLIAGVASLVMFGNLGGPRLWDRDEPRNAACAREMLERDDWVVPTFNGELRVLKPAFKYWLMILAYKVFGVSEFAARLGPALFAVATALVTYFLGRRLFSARVGLWAGLILCSSLLFVAAGHMAKADAPLTFFSALAILIFVLGAFKPINLPTDEGNRIDAPTQGQDFPHSLVWGILLYAAVGMAALAKGLPGLLLPPAVIGMYLLIVRLPQSNALQTQSWWRRCVAVLRPFAPLHFVRTFWLMRPITALVVTLAVAAPWYVLVGLRTDGEFLRGFFLEHHLGRALQPLENHSGPFLIYYLGTILVGFFPWSVFAAGLVIGPVAALRQGHPWRFGYLLAACWVGVYVVIFSCAQTKLPSYITPCFPALALLLGAWIDQAVANVNVNTRRLTSGVVLLGIFGIAIAVGCVVAARHYVPGGEWLGVIGLILVLGACAAWGLLRRQRLMPAGVALVVAALAFNAAVFGVGLARIGRHYEHQAICAAIYNRSADPQIGSFGNLQPSWVFYAKRVIQPLYLNKAPDGPEDPWKVQLVPAARFFRQDGNRFIITNDEDWQYLRPFLPADAAILAESPRFMRSGRWLLIGHDMSMAKTQR